ncbi:ATP-binding protein [Paenibacillus sp. LHD-38]|uniref:ATP-binding protein n=1 Tax=Paenibacillus sp. LHD-38 TaxID=3072143 RepID=UPI00280CFCEC|nr:ATP-binding protein [Paenibacillus sp. LHD-38]MDQ8734247.1 ATP-binding protein [Paenibacillus sp. LHD-38]
MMSDLKKQILDEGSYAFVGNRVTARYTEEFDPMHQHNVYLAALPSILSDREAAYQLRLEPAYLESERQLSIEYRQHAVQRLVNVVQPTANQLELHQRFSRVIRSGYVTRNPLSAEWNKQLRSAFPNLLWDEVNEYTKPVISPSATGFSIIGTSGVGKTKSVERVLAYYPQLIVHHEYNGNAFDRHQLVWLKLECPYNGSLKALVLNFFQSVDVVMGTDFYRKFHKSRRSADELLPDMAIIASSLGLGVLVIDEIQRLSLAHSGGAEKMLNFFVKLNNQIGVPVVIVGTHKAQNILTKELAQIRRGLGQGDMIWSNQENDEQWQLFVKKIWKYQFTTVETPLDNKLKDALYEESQGILDIAVKLYMLTQWSVIGQSNEKITPAIIKDIARECMKSAQPILSALRNGRTEDLIKYGDVIPLSQEYLEDYLKTQKERVILDGRLNTLQNQQKAEKWDQINVADEELLVIQIAMALINAGVDENTAKDCAKKSLQFNGASTDLKVAMWDAFDLARKERQNVTAAAKSKKSPSTKKNSSKTMPYSEQDLRRIVEQGYKDGIPPYQSLHEAGYIHTSLEFHTA